MREILFRGKRIDNNEWVYGDLTHNHNGLTFIEYWAEDKSRNICLVDPESVCHEWWDEEYKEVQQNDD